MNKKKVHNINKHTVISVITIVLNDKQNIDKTISSVIGQTYKYIEYIIIDGGSVDGTVDVIKHYEADISKWLSEKDGGIYHAMNKGLEIATGEWVIFINSGDIINTPYVLEDIAECITPEIDVIYGDCLVEYKDLYVRRVNARSLRYLWKGSFTSHQSVIARKIKIIDYKFNTYYRFAADHDMFCKLYFNGGVFLYKNYIISTISSGGFSDSNRFKVYLEFFDIFNVYFRSIMGYVYFSYKFMDLSLRLFVKKIFPKKYLTIIRNNKFFA